MSDISRAVPLETEAPGYRWVIIPLMMIGHMWGYIVISSLGYLLPGIREGLGLSPIEEGLLGSAPSIGNLFLAIPAAWLLSRIRPKLLTTLSFLLASVFILLKGWAPIFIFFFLGRLLFGLTLLVREPARALLIRQWIPPNEIMIFNAISTSLWGIVSVGFILTPIVLELMDNSWRNTLFLFAGISLAITIVWQIMGRERVTPEYEAALRSQERNPVTSILRYRELHLAGLGLIGIGMNWSAFITFWPSYMLDNFDVSLRASSELLAISGGASAIGGIGVALLVRRTGKKRLVLTITGILMALSSVGMLWTESYTILVFISLANGLSWTFFPITWTIPFELKGIKPREVAVAVGFQQTAMYVGMFIGPILVGLLQEVTGDLRTALVVPLSFSLAMSLGAVLMPRRLDQPALEPQPVRP